MVRRLVIVFGALLVVLCGVAGARVASAQADASGTKATGTLDCAVQPCAAVLPGAAKFERVPHKPYWMGLDADGDVVGWVALSTDVVDIKAYSGEPLVTLVGLLPDGVISGAEVLEHSEPILLVGIPEQALTDFVDFYPGRHATERIVVGKSTDPDTASVDIISGATVTALAQNKTVLETARNVGVDVGAFSAGAIVPGRFVHGDTPLSWKQMISDRVFGRLTVTNRQMGVSDPGDFIDLYFTIADAPQVGIALLGQGNYDWMMRRLEPDEHILVILGNGSSSFKGSGFVRGGIFDRVRVEQGLTTILFTDKDYDALSRVDAEGAPAFKEGAVFIARGGKLDPGAPFDLVFLGSVYDQKSGFGREFKTLSATHRLPKSVYHLDGPDPNQSIWRQAWRNTGWKKWALGAFLVLIAGLFVARRWTTGDMRRLRTIHLLLLVVALGGLGFVLRAQPSVTQILTAVGSITGGWRWELFLSEPLNFFGWIFIIVVTLVWGRGVFCGWVCPYGALSELLYKFGRLVKLPHFELPESVHRWLRHLRYVVLAVLVGTFLFSAPLGEVLAEVEPFKTTFFVAPWTRPLGWFLWWLALLLLALVWWRPFCRYVCPLGGGIAILSSVRFSGPRRVQFCGKCKICAHECEPRAIRTDGTIDPRECLSCMECEANYRDVEVCPPLIGVERLLRKPAAERTDADEQKLAQLRQEGQRR